jgi:hypothetical protein
MNEEAAAKKRNKEEKQRNDMCDRGPWRFVCVNVFN